MNNNADLIVLTIIIAVNFVFFAIKSYKQQKKRKRKNYKPYLKNISDMHSDGVYFDKKNKIA